MSNENSMKEILDEYTKNLKIVQQEKKDMLNELDQLNRQLAFINDQLLDHGHDLWNGLIAELDLDLNLLPSETVLTTLINLAVSDPTELQSASDGNNTSLEIVEEFNQIENFYTTENIANEMKKLEIKENELDAEQIELVQDPYNWSDDYKKEQFEELQKKTDNVLREQKLLADYEIFMENNDKELQSLIAEFEQTEQKIEELERELE